MWRERFFEHKCDVAARAAYAAGLVIDPRYQGILLACRSEMAEYLREFKAM